MVLYVVLLLLFGTNGHTRLVGRGPDLAGVQEPGHNRPGGSEAPPADRDGYIPPGHK